jgi:hypothetical protein
MRGRQDAPKVKDLQVRDVTRVVEGIRSGKMPVGLPPQSPPRSIESPFSRRHRHPSNLPTGNVLGKKLVFGPKGKGKKKHRPRTSKRLFRGNRIHSW